MKRASYLTFNSLTYNEGVFHFSFLIDGKGEEIVLSHSHRSDLSVKAIESVGFNLGMCYLLDLAEIVLPEKIFIFSSFSENQMTYWKQLYEEVVREKLFALNLDLSIATIPWESLQSDTHFDSFPVLNQKKGYALCLTGGKESLALLKLLENREQITLFYLNLEKSLHRRKVFESLSDTFLSIRTYSNRYQVINPLKEEYGQLFSGVDMAHLVFNTLLFSSNFESVLIGNEYSANFPNEVYQGYSINHQFVKTVDFAKRINTYIHSYVTNSFSYESPFFGLYEYRIADILFKDDRYLELWTSCNQASDKVNFCCNCSKCAFTYLISRVRRDEKFLSQFFSKNLLDEVSLYKPIIDFVGKKPLDCVGDKKEAWVAIEDLKQQNVINNVIRYYDQNIFPQIRDVLPLYQHEVKKMQKVPIEIQHNLMSHVIEALQ